MSKIQQDFFVAARAGSGDHALQRGTVTVATLRPQAPVVRDRLIANMSVSVLSVIPTLARDRPSPHGNRGRFGSRGTRIVSGVGMS